jgi:hypothetical protein
MAIVLTFKLAGLTDGKGAGSAQLNQPTTLVHSNDFSYRCCWFSSAIDFGDNSGNPAYWMLQKTAVGAWSLYLRRVSNQVAHYSASRKNDFPMKLNRKTVDKEFKNWPLTIKISPG